MSPHPEHNTDALQTDLAEFLIIRDPNGPSRLVLMKVTGIAAVKEAIREYREKFPHKLIIAERWD